MGLHAEDSNSISKMNDHMVLQMLDEPGLRESRFRHHNHQTSIQSHTDLSHQTIGKTSSGWPGAYDKSFLFH